MSKAFPVKITFTNQHNIPMFQAVILKNVAAEADIETSVPCPLVLSNHDGSKENIGSVSKFEMVGDTLIIHGKINMGKIKLY